MAKACPNSRPGRYEGQAFPCATEALDAMAGLGYADQDLGDVETSPSGHVSAFSGPVASGETLADLKVSADLDLCSTCAKALLAATGGALLFCDSFGFRSARLFPSALAYAEALAEV